MENTILIIILYTLVGILEIILGIPLLLEKIKPNWFYGFRLPKTMSSKDIWYKSNKYVGRDFIITGIIVTLGSLFLLMIRNNMSLNLIVLIGSFLVLITIILVLIRSLIYLKKL
jgi:uncharacterized membrane protein